MSRALGLFLLLLVAPASARELLTNQVQFLNAPTWLTEYRLQRAIDRVQTALEWDIRRIRVTYYEKQPDYDRAATLNFRTAAFFRRKDATIHLGPAVDDKTFERIFCHELVHAILFQKYQAAIPAWLEEGLANYIGKTETVDYKWLAKQPATDVTRLAHPASDAAGSHYHYQASTAVIEMIAKRCSLPDLLRLSVGAKLTTYLTTYCEIKDLNSEFTRWVKGKS